MTARKKVRGRGGERAGGGGERGVTAPTGTRPIRSRGNVILNALRYAGTRTHGGDEWCKRSRRSWSLRYDYGGCEGWRGAPVNCESARARARLLARSLVSRKPRYRNFLCSA